MGRTEVPEPMAPVVSPHNLEAERVVLGAMLMSADRVEQAIERLVAVDFYRAAHKLIFLAIVSLWEAGQAVDFVTVSQALRALKGMGDAGGPAYLSSLTDGLPRLDAAHLAAHLDILKEQSRLRQAIQAASGLVSGAQAGETPAAELVTTAADRLYAIGEAATPGRPVLLRDLVTPGMEVLEEAHSRRSGVSGLSTGFRDLDDMTSGFHPGDLILLAARTSVGKTALGMNIARAVGQTAPVLVFSLEMSRLQLFLRMFSSESGVDSQRMRTGRLWEADWPKLAAAMTPLAELPILIDDTPAISLREVRSRSRQVKAERGLALIVIDYLQLMRGRGKFDTRSQEIGSISRGLKAIAKELQVPVLALAQLNRASEAAQGRSARKPQLSDLRESGDLENDADVVLMIYRKEPKEDAMVTATSREAEIIVAKQRNGPTGSVTLLFDKECLKFSNEGRA